MKLSEICKFIEDAIAEMERKIDSIPSLRDVEQEVGPQVMRLIQGRDDPAFIYKLIGDIYYRTY